MSLRQISTRLELSFWQIIIVLLTESQAIQRLIKWAYSDFVPASAGFNPLFEKRKMFLWAAVGLGLGSIIGLLNSIF